jgi:hypothetical protein
MTKSQARIAALFLTFIVAVFVVWILIYPSDSDPKNIKYVLWKNDLYQMNLDEAVGTMIGDVEREKLVVGKSKVQLQKKFGYLVSPSDSHPYMRSCYLESPWKDRDVLLIRGGPWMVLFSGEKATELRLCKV